MRRGRAKRGEGWTIQGEGGQYREREGNTGRGRAIGQHREREGNTGRGRTKAGYLTVTHMNTHFHSVWLIS